MKVPEPQFEGQTKTKLGNNEVKGIVDSWTFAFLDTYFEENPAVAKKILQKAELAKRAREAAKKARDITRRKTVLNHQFFLENLPIVQMKTLAELNYSSLRVILQAVLQNKARDRSTQAILPLKGKILNVEKARLIKCFQMKKLKHLFAAIGCGIRQRRI